jgi:homoserine kinase
MSKSIKVFAPASVSNVGPGFDLMGFALEHPGDEIIVTRKSRSGILIRKISGDGNVLPKNPKLNTTTVAIKSLLDKYKLSEGLEIEIRKKMGIGSGLGSSAASSVGGVFAVNKLLDLKLTKDELLEHALAGEIIASGSLHADNIAPALYGGFIVVRSYDPIEILKINYPRKLYVSIVYPDIVIKTCEARKMLPRMVPRKTAVAQAGNSAGLITGLLTSDYELIGKSIKDSIAEPHRSKLIPCYDAVREAAFNAGALNCNITGSGPSMFAFSLSEDEAKSINTAMKKAVKHYGYNSKTYISKINRLGPKVTG